MHNHVCYDTLHKAALWLSIPFANHVTLRRYVRHVSTSVQKSTVLRIVQCSHNIPNKPFKLNIMRAGRSLISIQTWWKFISAFIYSLYSLWTPNGISIQIHFVCFKIELHKNGSIYFILSGLRCVCECESVVESIQLTVLSFLCNSYFFKYSTDPLWCCIVLFMKRFMEIRFVWFSCFFSKGKPYKFPSKPPQC